MQCVCLTYWPTGFSSLLPLAEAKPSAPYSLAATCLFEGRGAVGISLYRLSGMDNSVLCRGQLSPEGVVAKAKASPISNL